MTTPRITPSDDEMEHFEALADAADAYEYMNGGDAATYDDALPTLPSCYDPCGYPPLSAKFAETEKQ